MELPIIHDAASAASALVNISLSDYHFTEIEIVQAAPYASSLSPVVGAVNMMCSTAEGLLFRRIFPNPVFHKLHVLHCRSDVVWFEGDCG